MELAEPCSTAYQDDLYQGTLAANLQPEVDAFLAAISSKSPLSTAELPSDTPHAIAFYEAIESAVRRWRNSRARIDLLPVDVIHCIFAETLDLSQIHDIDFTLASIETHRMRLYRLRCVSTSWNTFILASPVYWAAVNIGLSSESIQATLRRAQTTPLCLYTLGLTRKQTMELTSPKRRALLQERLAQTRSFRTSETKISRFCQRILGSHLPKLATIELNLPEGWEDDENPFSNLELPSLRQIKTIEWIPDMSPTQLGRLQKLLTACTNLRSLNVQSHNFLASLNNSEEVSSSLTLPHLQVLALDFGWSRRFGSLTRKLVIPTDTLASLTIKHLQRNSNDSAKALIDDISDFIIPRNPSSFTPEVAMIRLNCPSGSTISFRSEMTYSAGKRSFHCSGPRTDAQAEQYLDIIKGVHTKLKEPPIALELVQYSPMDYLVRHLSRLNVRTLRSRSSPVVNDVLRLAGSYDNRLPSGTQNTTEWPFESLQELVIEGSQINVKQLTRIVGMRQRYLRTSSKPWINQVSLVDCHLIGMPFEAAEKELGILGVTLSKMNCSYSRFRDK